VPFTERYNDPESLFEMKHSTQADMVFLLERATTNTVKKVTVEDGLAKLIAINQKILSYQSENTIIWYASSNPCFKIDSMLSKERHILSKFSKDKEFFLVQYRNSTYQASELIRKTLGVG
jgi:hypothetical protein